MSKEILVFLQNDSEKVINASLSALTFAHELASNIGGSVSAVVLSENAQDIVSSLNSADLTKLYYSNNAVFSKPTAKNIAANIADIIEQNQIDYFVTAANSTGKDFAPLLAQMISAGMASDLIALNEDGSVLRPIYAGNALADVEINTDKKVYSVRTSAFAPYELQNGSPETVELQDIKVDEKASVQSYDFPETERPELGDAQVVVSGGRAFGSKEEFDRLLLPLSDKLQAAIGASRAAVDAGYAPNDWQVGQTGKIVAPNLYIAIGISGAIQHLAGMKDSKVIVAINKDAEAPIFEISDYGLVGDLFEVIPELTEKL